MSIATSASEPDTEKGSQSPEAGVRSRSWLQKIARCFYIKPSEEFPPITRPVDESVHGYNEIATFQSSDRSLLLYRGFDYLHCRLLSHLQWEVNKLEEELDSLDQYELDQKDPERRLVSKREDGYYIRKEDFPNDFKCKFWRTRAEIWSELRVKLMEYDDALLKVRQISELHRPSSRDYGSVLRWFIYRRPVVYDEWQYIRCREDMLTLNTGRESATFDARVDDVLTLLDKCLRKVNCNIIKKIFSNEILRGKSANESYNYLDAGRVDTLIGIMMALMILTLLVLPIVALYEVSVSGQSPPVSKSIGILIAFTLLFSLMMSLLTKAMRHEVFAASAAYCAILVVFIGNLTNQSEVIRVSG